MQTQDIIFSKVQKDKVHMFSYMDTNKVDLILKGSRIVRILTELFRDYKKQGRVLSEVSVLPHSHSH